MQVAFSENANSRTSDTSRTLDCMDAIQIIESLVSSLALPVSVVVVAVMFRRQISQLLTARSGRLRVGPVEAEWDDQLAEVQADTLAALPDRSPTRPLLRELFAGAAQTNPKHAILEAFCALESTLREMVGGPGGSLTYSGHGGPVELVREANERGIVDQATVRAVDGVAVLRNLVIYESDDAVTPERACDYFALVDAVLFTLDTQASRASMA